MITTFWLVLGYACNNRCYHCYASPSSFRKKWMNPHFAKEVMEVLRKEAKTCLLIGGEPTLYPDLSEIISFGANSGLKMVIVSNGRKLKDRSFTKSLFLAGLDRAVVSLEGSREETHNSITRSKSFDDTTNGIRMCAELGKVNTLTTICRNNSHEIFEIIKLAYKLGATKAVLNCAIPVLDKDQISASYCLSPTELAETVNQVFFEAIKDNLSFQLNATFPLCLLQEEVLEEAFKRDWISVGCHMYRGKGVVFDSEGNILPCTHFSENPLFRNTIVKDKKFSLKGNFYERWADDTGAAGRFRLALWRYPAKKCVGCKYWGGCVGGCPLLWSYFDPLVYIDQERKGGDETGGSAKGVRKTQWLEPSIPDSS